jgi:hypothetical protein
MIDQRTQVRSMLPESECPAGKFVLKTFQTVGTEAGVPGDQNESYQPRPFERLVLVAASSLAME